MTQSSKPDGILVRRRGVLAACMGLIAGVLVAGGVPAWADVNASSSASQAAQQIANHFSSVHTMSGQFVQFGPQGGQTGGQFYIERPGKIRFNYNAPSNFRVISDGKSVLIHNPRLNTYDLYPLSKTPLKLLLGNHIDLSGNEVQDVKQEDDLTTIKLADKSLFGNSTIAMMFDPKTDALKQWTITDAQGKDTTVMIFNVKEGAALNPSLFTINYNKISSNPLMQRSH